MLGSVKKLHTEFGFQFAYLVGQGRLGDKLLPCNAGEIQCVGQSDEVF